MLLLETNFFLEELHEICNHMSEDTQTLLGSIRFGDLYEIVEYLMNNDYFYLDINCISERLKKNSFNYPKKIREFHKTLLEIKKKFSQGQKKILDLDNKYNLFNKENFLLSFSNLIWNYYLWKLLTTQILTCQKFTMVMVLTKAMEWQS